MPDRRAVLLGACLGLGAAAAGVVRLRPGTDLGFDPASALPGSIDRWRAIEPEDVILPSEDMLSARIYDELAIRSYIRPDMPPITLVMAYGGRQDYAFQVHRPEICYPASGFTIDDLASRDLPIAQRPVAGNVMRARRGARREAVLYWTRIGQAFPQTIGEQRLAVIRGVREWRVEEGMLMRLSMPISDGDDPFAQLATFARRMIAISGPRGWRLFLGEG